MRAGLILALAVGLVVVGSGSAGSVLATPISSDPYLNTDSQHATQVEPDSFAHGNTIVATIQTGRFQNGGGSSNIAWATSTDSGRHWTTGMLPGTTANADPPGPWARISDPSVAYDPLHDVWMISTLAFGTASSPSGSPSAILTSRSTDGGLTWDLPVTTSFGVVYDKNWITCDTWPSSPHYGNCYTEWDDNGQGNRLLMSTSTDGGLTWGPDRSPGGLPSGLGGQPVVQLNGNVIVPYEGGAGIRSFRSTDGGATWLASVPVATVSEHGVNGNLRASALPSAEVDGAGRVYVAWQDCRFRSGCTANDIVYSTSTDGNTWTAVTRVPIDPTSSGVDHFIPGIAVDKATSGSSAHIALGYYYYPVSSCSVSTCQLTFGFVSSLDGGATWTPPTQVTGPMNLSWIANTDQGRMVGDYVSTSFTGDGKAHPLFAIAKPPTSMCSPSASPLQPSTQPLHRSPRGSARARSRRSSAGATIGTIKLSAVRTRRNARKRLTSTVVGVRGLRGARTCAAAMAVAAGLVIVAAGSAGSVLSNPISNDKYTNTNGDGQHKTQLEPDSFAFGNTIVALTQSGRYVNGGGASNLMWASSQNAGQTWTTGGMPGTTVNEGGPWPRISDPSVAYDPQDDVWLLLGLGIDAGGSGHILLVDRSTDGGVTWSNPVNAGESGGSFWDKTWITCDTFASSPHYGNCYIEFDDNGAGNEMSMVTSTDGGLTWGPVRSGGCSSGLGGQPVAQPNGNVIVPFSANGGAEYSIRSTDGGNTWGGCTLIAGVTEHNVAGQMRTFSLPSAEVAGDGRVYVAWQDCRFRSGCPGNDIVYSTSMDGLTWSAVTRIPIDAVNSGADHFLPGIAVDKNTSGSGTHLAVGYYYFPVSNCTTTTCDLTVGFVSSLDGGATWTTGRAITGAMKVTWIANTNQGRMVGDYISTSFTGDGKAHPVFSWAKPLDNNASCSHTTVCRQRLASASFDITQPQMTPRAKSETGPVFKMPRSKQSRAVRLRRAN